MRVRFFSLNVFIRPPGTTLISDAAGGHGDFKDERLDLILAELAHFDIVCLQELFAAFSGRQPAFIAAARRHGLVHHAVSPCPWLPGRLAGTLWAGVSGGVGGLLDAGLVILSRFPIVAVNHLQFRTACHTDWLAAKGALHVRVQLSAAAQLSVVNTHTQSFYSLDDQRARRAHTLQILELARFIRRCCSDSVGEGAETTCVLAGDFNLNSNPKSVALRAGNEVHLVTAAEARERGELPDGPDSGDTEDYKRTLGQLHEQGLPFIDLMMAAHSGNPPPTIGIVYDDRGDEIDTMYDPQRDFARLPDRAAAGSEARTVGAHGRALSCDLCMLLEAKGGRHTCRGEGARVEALAVAERLRPFRGMSDHRALACDLVFEKT